MMAAALCPDPYRKRFPPSPAAMSSLMAVAEKGLKTLCAPVLLQALRLAQSKVVSSPTLRKAYDVRDIEVTASASESQIHRAGAWHGKTSFVYLFTYVGETTLA